MVGVNDLVTTNGALTLDGTLVVTELPGFGNGLYRLFDYAGALTDKGLDLQAGFLAAHPGSTIVAVIPNQVNLVVIPEPGATALLVAFAGAGLCLCRRRARARSLAA